MLLKTPYLFCKKNSSWLTTFSLQCCDFNFNFFVLFFFNPYFCTVLCPSKNLKMRATVFTLPPYRCPFLGKNLEGGKESFKNASAPQVPCCSSHGQCHCHCMLSLVFIYDVR